MIILGLGIQMLSRRKSQVVAPPLCKIKEGKRKQKGDLSTGRYKVGNKTLWNCWKAHLMESLLTWGQPQIILPPPSPWHNWLCWGCSLESPQLKTGKFHAKKKKKEKDFLAILFYCRFSLEGQCQLLIVLGICIMRLVPFALGSSEEPPKSSSWIQPSVNVLWLSKTLLGAWASSWTEWLTGESQGPQRFHTNYFRAESHSGGMWESPRQQQGCCSIPQGTTCRHVWHRQPWHVLHCGVEKKAQDFPTPQHHVKNHPKTPPRREPACAWLCGRGVKLPL